MSSIRRSTTGEMPSGSASALIEHTRGRPPARRRGSEGGRRGGRGRRLPLRPRARPDSSRAALVTSSASSWTLSAISPGSSRSSTVYEPSGRSSCLERRVRSSSASVSWRAGRGALAALGVAIKARALAGVTGGTGGHRERDQRILVAVHPERHERERVARRLAFPPQLLARAAPKMDLPGLERQTESVGVHVGQGEHLARSASPGRRTARARSRRSELPRQAPNPPSGHLTCAQISDNQGDDAGIPA